MRTRRGIKFVALVAVVASLAVGTGMFAGTSSGSTGLVARGAGTTMVRGGTGDPSFVPVLTKVAFFWRNGTGGFECLALAPSEAAGDPGSGRFDTNAMYVTGGIDSATIDGDRLILKGQAEVTGIGAGSNQPFVAVATEGGPGATLKLKVSGLTFNEILLEGAFRF